MEISQNGIDLIKSFEGFSPTVYLCPAGYPTIGYGHRIMKNESFTLMSKKTGEDILKKDLDFFESVVNRYVEVNLTQNQFDALVSFAFNVGMGNFFRSTLRRFLNKEQYEKAAKEFDKWVYSQGKVLLGLAKRRKAEKELFLS